MLVAEKELLFEQIGSSAVCTVRVGGFCMTPVIRNGAKVVVERTDPQQLHVGDVVAYFIGSHLFVHRLCAKSDRTFQMKADNDNAVLHEISQQDILGRVASVSNPSLYQRLVNHGNHIVYRILRRISWVKMKV